MALEGNGKELLSNIKSGVYETNEVSKNFVKYVMIFYIEEKNWIISLILHALAILKKLFINR